MEERVQGETEMMTQNRRRMSLDDLVRTAMAATIVATRTTPYVRTHAARADPQAFLAWLERIKQATRESRAEALPIPEALRSSRTYSDVEILSL